MRALKWFSCIVEALAAKEDGVGVSRDGASEPAFDIVEDDRDTGDPELNFDEVVPTRREPEQSAGTLSSHLV